MASKVGVRELRQNLSVYLRRVAQGERFVVTDRREPVAELVPLAADEDEDAAWMRRNSLRPPTRKLQDLPPPIRLDDGGPSLADLIEQDREDRIG
jgi:prevent-host-death family protein